MQGNSTITSCQPQKFNLPRVEKEAFKNNKISRRKKMFALEREYISLFLFVTQIRK